MEAIALSMPAAASDYNKDVSDDDDRECSH